MNICNIEIVYYKKSVVLLNHYDLGYENIDQSKYNSIRFLKTVRVFVLSPLALVNILFEIEIGKSVIKTSTVTALPPAS